MLWFCSGRPYPYSTGLRLSHRDINLVMLETDYSGLFGQYHTCSCWCLGSWSRHGISSHGIDSMGQATFRVSPLWIWSSVKQNLDIIGNVNIYRAIHVLQWRTVYALAKGLFWCLFPELRSNRSFVMEIHLPPVNFPYKWPVIQISAVVFYAGLNKQLNKQSSCRWLGTPWRSCNFTQ